MTIALGDDPDGFVGIRDNFGFSPEQIAEAIRKSEEDDDTE